MNSSFGPKPRGGIKNTQVSPSDDAGWDQFVSNHKHASLYYSSKIRRLIDRTFNYQTYYLVGNPSEAFAGSGGSPRSNLTTAGSKCRTATTAASR